MTEEKPALRNNNSVAIRIMAVGNNMRGTMKVVYENGDEYEGETKNGKRDRKGTMKYADGEVYTGEWKDDNMHG